MPYIGVFAGPNYGLPATIHEWEVHHSIRAARESLAERAASGHNYGQRIARVDGTVSVDLMPCVDSGSYLQLYFVTAEELEELTEAMLSDTDEQFHTVAHMEHEITDNGPAYLLEIGPRGGIKIEKNF